jgi:hypothetical protein
MNQTTVDAVQILHRAAVEATCNWDVNCESRMQAAAILHDAVLYLSGGIRFKSSAHQR